MKQLLVIWAFSAMVALGTLSTAASITSCTTATAQHKSVVVTTANGEKL